MLLETMVILVAVNTVQDLKTNELEKYYWDCDTMFMKDELGGQDMLTCLEVTEEFKQRSFDGDHQRFMQYWRRENLQQWYTRGFTPRVEDLPRLRGTK